jgi:hypothetical protein
VGIPRPVQGTEEGFARDFAQGISSNQTKAQQRVRAGGVAKTRKQNRKVPLERLWIRP